MPKCATILPFWRMDIVYFIWPPCFTQSQKMSELYNLFSHFCLQCPGMSSVWTSDKVLCGASLLFSNSRQKATHIHCGRVSYDRCRDNAVGIATGYRLDDREVGVRVRIRSKIVSYSHRPDRLWGPLSLLYSGYRGLFLQNVKLTTHLQLVPRSRKCGCIHPLPYMPHVIVRN
jgi:hypothetical protein